VSFFIFPFRFLFVSFVVSDNISRQEFCCFKVVTNNDSAQFGGAEAEEREPRSLDG